MVISSADIMMSAGSILQINRSRTYWSQVMLNDTLVLLFESNGMSDNWILCYLKASCIQYAFQLKDILYITFQTCGCKKKGSWSLTRTLIVLPLDGQLCSWSPVSNMCQDINKLLFEGMVLRTFPVKQFHFKNKSGIRRDFWWTSSLSISILWFACQTS